MYATRLSILVPGRIRIDCHGPTTVSDEERPAGLRACANAVMTAGRVEAIRDCIEQALDPERLEIVDESHLHIGHAGAQDGRGHFRIRIAASSLEGLSRLQRHRRIYAALGTLMETDIHALSIEDESLNDS
jgi:BolA protein